jgi:hypothetical protein
MCRLFLGAGIVAIVLAGCGSQSPSVQEAKTSTESSLPVPERFVRQYQSNTNALSDFDAKKQAIRLIDANRSNPESFAKLVCDIKKESGGDAVVAGQKWEEANQQPGTAARQTLVYQAGFEALKQVELCQEVIQTAPSQSPVASAVPVVPDVKTMYIGDPPTNLRSAPDINSAVIGQYSIVGEAVVVKGKQGEWLEVSRGWIHQSQLVPSPQLAKAIEAEKNMPESAAESGEREDDRPVQGQAVTNGAFANAKNCAELEAMGISDFATEVGNKFDRDKDGIGCESN